MLVLSRHADEGVTITLEDGREIKVLAVQIVGDKVRLGFEAPRTIRINRDEVHYAIQRENESAAPAA